MENQDISRRTLLKGGGATFGGVRMVRVAGPAEAFGQSGEQVIPWLNHQPPPTALPPAIVGNLLVWGTLDSWLTPPSKFFYVTPPDDPFLASKRTYWGSNGQIIRRVLVS